VKETVKKVAKEAAKKAFILPFIYLGYEYY